MFLAMAKDIRVIIIKLADRLHNMRTLASLPPAKQRAIARETLDIYAPIAHRSGIWKIKWEIEDECLRYLDPAYREIVELVAKTRREREADVERRDRSFARRVRRDEGQCRDPRATQTLYSIYSKIKKGRDFSTIYDLTAIRIIVDSVKDCYAALGAVHAMWTPLPGRFKDYIAMPKPNMYQSLHTTVVGPTGEPLEIQIRTWEMHRTSEYGIAAHWRYKEGGKADQFENKLSWLRALLEWQKDMRDSRVFMENLKIDLFDSQVFVFSPRGDVFSIPAERNATRLCLFGTYRRRQPLRRSESQRPHRSARLSAGQRRYMRDPRQQVERASVAGLAFHRQDVQRKAQDQAVVPQGAPGRKRAGRPRGARAGVGARRASASTPRAESSSNASPGA